MTRYGNAKSHGVYRRYAVVVVSSNLRRLRKERNMLQREVAALVGAPKKYVADVEAGRRLPSIPRLYAFADAFGVDMNEVFLKPSFPSSS